MTLILLELDLTYNKPWKTLNIDIQYVLLLLPDEDVIDVKFFM